MMTILQVDPYSDLDATQTGILAGMGIGMLIFALALYLFLCYSLYKVFQKAGYSQPIAAFIPIWSSFALADVAKKKWWWGLLLCVPYVNVIAAIFICLRISKFFGKGDGFTVGLILLGFIFFPILGFGDAQYNPDALPDERVEN